MIKPTDFAVNLPMLIDGLSSTSTCAPIMQREARPWGTKYQNSWGGRLLTIASFPVHLGSYIQKSGKALKNLKEPD